MRSRGAFIALAIVAIAVAFAVTRFHGHGNKGSTPSNEAPKNALRISFGYSPEKEKLLLPLVAAYNARHVQQGSRTVFIDATNVSSGAAETALAHKTLQLDAWTPSSSLWGRLLDYEADTQYAPRKNPSLVRTPLVIAMWEPLARALGWPRKPVGFAEVLRLATSPKGWAIYGKPQYGEFRLGHTNPDFSTSGLSMVAAQYYTAAGKLEGLTEADVDKPAVRDRVRAIERSIVHYGDTTLFFEDQLKQHGLGYASAVAMEEATLLDFNETRPAGTPKLVGIYPREGTFYSDDPYIVLNAPWVTRSQHAAASAFGTWLQQQLTPAKVAKYGFRPGNPNVPPQAPIDAAHGVDPKQPTVVLGLPEPAVLAKIRRAWHQDRKAANVELLVDTSGSMGDENKLGQAKQGLQVFLKQLSPRDRVGLLAFDTTPHVVEPPTLAADAVPKLRRDIASLVPGGSTSLYDAVNRGWHIVDALRDDSRINAIVVLSDGADTASNESLKALVHALEARSSAVEGRQIRVFTIAYGSDANPDVLGKIADASGGRPYSGDPSEIAGVYVQISSFF